MSLKLYMHPLASYCHKVLIALYEHGTPFTPQIVNLMDAQERAKLAALWPTAKVPLLYDGKLGRAVPETSIMIEYIDRYYPGARRLIPEDFDAGLEVRLWDRLFDQYVMTPMQQIVADRLRPDGERDPRAVPDATATLHMAYDMIERHFAEPNGSHPWMAGADFSLADCAAAPSLFYASIVVPFPPSHVRLAAYFERLMDRPSVARTIKEAQPYFDLFPFKDAMPERFRGPAA
jgi:glutathione S-transferase